MISAGLDDFAIVVCVRNYICIYQKMFSSSKDLLRGGSDGLGFSAEAAVPLGVVYPSYDEGNRHK
jgi:hypothetical protein